MARRSEQFQVVPSGNPVADRKLELALEGLPPNTERQLINEFSCENRMALVDFLNNSVTTENIRDGTKRVYICNLLYLSRFTGQQKNFKEVTLDDILTYLQSLHRPIFLDPYQKWINTHNNRLVTYQKFFKWLYYPDMPARERPTPDVVKDLPLLTQSERTHVQAKDLWTSEEDALFLKYCEEPRFSLYHMMSLDTSARPHEILALRIGDVKIKISESNKMYAEVEVGRGGKTKSRTVPLIISLPWYKSWLEKHPEAANPHAYIFRSLEPRARYRNIPIKPSSVYYFYWRLKQKFFPKLLDRADIPPEDKAKILQLLAKPWNPYLRRHISLTEKARLVNEYTLRLHAGWTKSSKMVEIYTHELGGESSQELLAAYGVTSRSIDGKANLLKPIDCPNCREPNKPGTRFCANQKCQMPLTFDGYQEIKEKEHEKEEQVETLTETVSGLSDKVMELAEEIKALKKRD